MGIKGLTALLSEHAPACMKEHDIKTLFGRKVAIDASMSIYQFLIAVRQRDGELLTNEAGETTSHLMGFFYRTIRIVENGIKPAYVFDGKPPELKKGVLAKRFERREEAKEGGEEAKEIGTAEDVDRYSRRTVKVTSQHNEECRKLLGLMGIPVVIAPSEAEAQCAELARGGKVYAAGSEDMDTLTFNAPILLRHLTFSEAKKQPISEINLELALKGLEMNMSQFIDLCILLGCDYLEPIKGIGPKSALKLVKEHGTLEAVVEHFHEKATQKAAQAADEESDAEEAVADDQPAPTSEFEVPDDVDVETEEAEVDAKEKADAEHSEKEEEEDRRKKKGKAKSGTKGKGKSKKGGKAADEETDAKQKPKKAKARGGIQIPEYWPWEESKKLFENPDVLPADQVELEWKNPDVEGLIEFLVKEKGFNEERVRKGAEKLQKFLHSKQQGRLDGFFTVKAKEPGVPKPKGKAADTKGKVGTGKGMKRKVSGILSLVNIR
ncbi:hypothetical protein AX15_005883 [Amanita polypyramis BW_CC]|nr:hypothetical protein AX15_005883 [Amanita polypyramis BW_CC]